MWLMQQSMHVSGGPVGMQELGGLQEAKAVGEHLDIGGLGTPVVPGVIIAVAAHSGTAGSSSCYWGPTGAVV